MNNELAKELKDAGFTQANQWLSTVNGQYFPRVENDGYFDTLPWPTLSELIEACGESFYALYAPPTVGIIGWAAVEKGSGFIPGGIMDFGHCGGIGPTPEEAVSKLWLALNKKQS